MVRVHRSIQIIAALLLIASCSGDDDDDAASIDAAQLPDADVPDAVPPTPDALVLCPGELLFHGDYVDWDSTDTMFKGVAGATMTEVGNPSNTYETHPNGRGILCLTPGLDTAVEFAHADYLTMLFGVSAEVTARGTFTSRGLKPDRADALFTDDFSLTRDPAAGQLVVYTGLAGATVEIGNSYEGAFPLPDGVRTFFANVDLTGDATTVTVTPPAAETCVGRASVPLAAGVLSYTMYACQ